MDKRLLWGGIGGGVLLVAIILIVHFAGKGDEPEKKKTDSGESSSEGRFPSADTEEGRAAIKKMFDMGDPIKLRKYINGINPETALKVKDVLATYMQRLDTGSSFDDAYKLATLLASAKDDRVLQKIIDLGMKKKDAHTLLRPYAAAGASAVIARATADAGGNVDTYASMLRDCIGAGSEDPIRAAAEGSEVAAVAWICGDELYERRIPIKPERAQAWLADSNPRAQASGVRQMSVQKDFDRDAALAPFAEAAAALEARTALLNCAAKDKTLSRDHIRKLMQIDDLEFFEGIVFELTKYKLIEYIEDLEKIQEARMGSGIGRTAGRTVQQLKNVRGDK
ncbi:MAG: hypothetical protein HYY18_09450 [Planctomycetes bacterium]|nr:hypothetical protein [Planctomycetota bacterium]